MKASWIVGGLLLVVAVLAALTLRGLHESNRGASPSPAAAPATESASGARSGKAAAPVPAEDVPPWKASARAVGELPPGTVPVTAVNPPPPDPHAPMPPPPVEPPNPALHRPPMDNPGGVDGDRPPRPVPGVETP